MGKLILFLIIIGIIYFFFFKKPQTIANSENKNEDNEDLILCEKCNTFTPKNEIVNINGKNICKECYDNSK